MCDGVCDGVCDDNVQIFYQQEKLISYEVNDPFVHQLVKVLQCTLDSVKVHTIP